MMTPIKNFPNPMPPGLNTAIEAAGIILVNEGGVRWLASDAKAAEAVIASYDPAPAEKAEKEAAADAERKAKQAAGVDYIGARFGLDEKSLAAVATQLAGDAPVVSWLTLDGTFVKLDKAGLAGLQKTMAARLAEIFAEQEANSEIAAILAAKP